METNLRLNWKAKLKEEKIAMFRAQALELGLLFYIKSKIIKKKSEPNTNQPYLNKKKRERDKFKVSK